MRTRPPSRHTVSARLGTIALVFALSASTFAIGDPPAQTTPASGDTTLAGRPHVALAGFTMANDADERDKWVAGAVEETLTRCLTRVPGLIVVPGVRLYQGRQELTEGGVAPDWPRVATALGADVLITGHCSGSPSAVTLRLELRPLGDSGRTPGETTLPPGRVLEIFAPATRWVLGQLGVEAGTPEQQRLIFDPPARTPSALEYYMRAVTAGRAHDFRAASEYAAESADYDPRYRPALALLAQLDIQAGPAGMRQAGARLHGLRDVAEAAHDSYDMTIAELGLGVLLSLAGSFDAAYTRMESAIAMSYERDEPYGQIAAMNTLCDLYLTRMPPTGAELSEDARKRFQDHNLRHAAQWQEASLTLSHALGDSIAETTSANKLALIHEQLGNENRALALHEQALRAAERSGSRFNQATVWLYLTQSHQRRERWDEALNAAQHCLEVASDPMKPMVRIALGAVHQGRGAPEEAFKEYVAAYEALRTGDDLMSQFKCLRQIANLHMELGRRDLAIAALQEAIDVAHALQLAEEQALQDQLLEWKNQ
ncbi:MAG: tetratricopeptide repeat protein [Phycisphaerae bacterium]|jgi:tetratricopeptide (TPR) repeat protein